MCDRCGNVTHQSYQRQLEEAIQTYGWAMQYVDGDGGRNPAFAYSLGLTVQGHPEFIVFDPDACLSYRGIKPLAWAVLQGRVFDEGDDLTEFFPQPDVAELLHFPHSATHLLAANYLFGRPEHDPVPALQLIWPSRIGLVQPIPSTRTPGGGRR